VFLGSLTYVVYKDSKYHVRCLTCCICSQRLRTGDFREKGKEFYCKKDYSKKFYSSSDDITDSQNSHVFVPIVKEHVSPHTWQEITVKSIIVWCSFCEESMSIGTTGNLCTNCNCYVHKDCKDQVSDNCGSLKVQDKISNATESISKMVSSTMKVRPMTELFQLPKGFKERIENNDLREYTITEDHSEEGSDSKTEDTTTKSEGAQEHKKSISRKSLRNLATSYRSKKSLTEKSNIM